MQTTFSSKSSKKKVRQLIQCALAGAALSLAVYPSVSRADVTLSPYDGYDITQHADGGFANPDPGYGNVSGANDYDFPVTDFENGVYKGTDYNLLTVDTGTDSTATPTFAYGTTLSLRQALKYADDNGSPSIVYFNSGGTDDRGITSNITNNILDDTNGPLIIDNPNADIIMKSHNYGITQSGAGWAPGSPSLEVNAGSLLYYATTNSPAYAQFPMTIGGSGVGNNSGHVQVYTVHSAGYGAGKQPIVNVIDMSSYGTFQANRYLRFNFNTASTPLNLHDHSLLEFGQHNTIYSDIDLHDESTFISNGGNTFFWYGNAGDGSQNVLNKDLNLYDSSNAVLGYKTSITGNLNVGTNNTDTPTVRLLGPTFVTGTATFGANSIVVATLNTPLTPSGHISQTGSPSYTDYAYDPNNVGNVRALLTVGGTLTVNDGAQLVIDSVNSNSLSVGQKYLIFTSANPSGLLNFNHNISTSLTPLTFSDLTLDGLNTNNYYVEVTGIDFANSFDDVTGGNREQRNFFNYIRDIAPENNLPGNVNATLLYLYNNLGSGPGYNYNVANSFLGDTYTAHAAQLYWNQKSFIDEVSDHLGNSRNMNSGESTFNLAGSGLNGVQSQLATLNQSLNNSRLGLAGVLNANGNNGLGNSGVWADAYGGRVNTKDDSGLGTPSWDGSTTGFAAGYTGGSDHFNYGVAVGHQKSDLSFNDRTASGNLEGYNAGLYASLNRKKSYLNGILSYSHFNNDATREDGIGTNTSSFKSHGLAAQVEYGMHVRQTKTSDFTPYASLMWSNNDRDSIIESGSGAGLTLDSNSNSTVTSQLGVRYNHRTYDKAGSLKGGIQAGVAWVHQFGDTDFPTNAHFTGAPGSFEIYNTPLSSNAAQVQLGAYGRLHNNVIGFVNYQGTFGSNEHVNSVTGGLGYQF